MCGAGASSTFVAARLRSAALAVGAEWVVTASSLDGVDSFADVILLGPHIADHRHEVARRAPRARVLVMPEDAFTDLDGARIRALIESTAPKGTS